MKPLSKADRVAIRGCLEVKAGANCRMGNGDRVISEGAVGYVRTVQQETGYYLVFWPYEPRQYKGDWRCGSFLPSTVLPTGNRG